MEQELDIQIERIDDVPLLLQLLKATELADVIDTHLHPHGNWGEMLSLGQTIALWLVYILSQGDHRACAVEEWADGLEETLRRLVSPDFSPKALCDDRLARALRYLAQDEAWEALEEDLNRLLVRVYALPGKTVRIDTSTISTYAQVTPEGLVQFGFSKDRRPDLPQVKVGLATLDPLGMPLFTLVTPGNDADDPLYMPLIARAHALLGPSKLYVGDTKMAAAKTRAAIHRRGDVYLCPAPRTIVPEETIWQYVKEAKAQGRLQVWQVPREDGTCLEGEGFQVQEAMRLEIEGEEVVWIEERWILRSTRAYERTIQQLEERLARAEAALKILNRRGRGKRRYSSQGSLAEAVQAILEHYRVAGLVKVTYRCERKERQVRRYRGQPPRLEQQEDWFVGQIERDEEALAAQREHLGWRVYLCNGTAQGESVDAATVIRAYHGQYIVERGFLRMKDRPIGIAPMYVHRDDHRIGLIRLFSLALRVVTLLEYVVQQTLARENKTLYGLYEGNPKRGTQRPTAERLLRAFRGLHLSVVRWGEQIHHQVSSLSQLQKDILHLLGFSEETYTILAAHSTHPPWKISER